MDEDTNTPSPQPEQPAAAPPSILDALAAERQSNTYKVWLPAVKKTVEFQPMTARQNKTLLAALVNAVKYQSEAPIVQHDILKANLVPGIVELDSLHPADVEVCLIALRAHNYDPKFMITKGEGGNTVDVEEVDLLAHLEYLQSKEFENTDFDPEFTSEVKHGKIEATVGGYTYKLDVDLAVFMKTVLDMNEREGKKMDSSGQSELFSEVVGLQILKHVRGIVIGKSTQDMSTVGVPDLNRIGDQLPSAFFTKAAKAVVEYGRKAVNPVVTTQEGNEIPVDSEFFVINNE